MIVAVAVVAVVASFNGLSSAQLAASHPVSGGTYEYGYRHLNPALRFATRWMFLGAKSASAATAALGFAGYILVAAGASTSIYRVSLALIVAGGIGRSTGRSPFGRGGRLSYSTEVLRGSRIASRWVE